MVSCRSYLTLGRQRTRRRAIAGVFLATILFASLFLAGLSYYLYESQSDLLADQGAQSRENEVQGASSESLAVTVSQVQSGTEKGWLVVNVYNSGGVTSSVMAVYVTDVLGQALSSSTTSTHSEFLVAPPDINVSLPLSLVPGESTNSVICGSGSSIGCSIMVNASACSSCGSGNTVYVSVLTGRGNTFTTQYPTPTTGTTSTASYPQTTSITSYSTTFISSVVSSTQVTSQTAVAGFQAGTNSLVLVMDACAGSSSTPFGTTCTTAPAIYSGQEVILTISVTNYADVAMSLYVDFQSVGTNGASVTGASPDDCASGSGYQTSTTTIPADTGTASTVTYVCTFTAEQGPTAGTVTFIGYAVGTYAAVPPAQVTSAEGLSNPVQLGNPESAVSGPFIGLGFNYASETSQTFTSGVIVPGSSDYVVWQAELENTANASVTILQYSSLLLARISQEEGYYIVQPVASWSSTLTAYACALGTNNAPSGAQCSPSGGVTALENCTTLGSGCVPTGDTVTLDFAASSVDSTTWEWGTASGLNPPEAVTMFILVVYDFYSGGSWHVLSQAVPITGTYLT